MSPGNPMKFLLKRYPKARSRAVARLILLGRMGEPMLKDYSESRKS